MNNFKNLGTIAVMLHQKLLFSEYHMNLGIASVNFFDNFPNMTILGTSDRRQIAKTDGWTLKCFENSFSESHMNLGMTSVIFFVDNFPNLTILGNLRTWRSIDYFDPESTNYFRAESDLSRLKTEARKKNWDIDFELENLDFISQ